MFTRIPSQRLARAAYVLLDTEDPYDAWSTGRDGPEDPQDGQGLRIAYDGTGAHGPGVTINGPDGEVDLFGLPEIRAVHKAMCSALRYAEAYGDPIPLAQWRREHGCPD